MAGAANAHLTCQLSIWNQQAGLGAAFGSDLGYTLPNSAVRSPDASWIPLESFQALTRVKCQKFIPFAPTFAAELCSPFDRRAVLRRKMREYRDQGTELGWLIDLVRRQVEIYRADGQVERLNDPVRLQGEAVLPGFELNLANIFDDH